MRSVKEQLSGNPKQIRELRVQNFVKMLCEHSRKLIETGANGKCEYRRLQMHLESLVDIAPTSSIDLASKLSTTDIPKLMDDINKTTRDMFDMSQIIARRVAVHNRLFPDSPVEGLSEAELDFINDINLSNEALVKPSESNSEKKRNNKK